ncbi:uncharacterized protein LOC132286729 [Cornus florida]|uniref:uncharacterized protein LOC132286729 n=1 Tax=Cornus florida TaxID=4283 RepID=UPI002897B1FC|nr:uncharacterized protein LOC132286729 [Cornus florida]
MLRKASWTSSSIKCCLFMILILTVLPSFPARKLYTSPGSYGHGNNYIGANKNNHEHGGSAVPGGPNAPTQGANSASPSPGTNSNCSVQRTCTNNNCTVYKHCTNAPNQGTNSASVSSGTNSNCSVQRSCVNNNCTVYKHCTSSSDGTGGTP